MTKEKNILKLVKELSLMRGAALKIGQMLSLESGEILPPKINESLALLRNQAYRMPPKQLKLVLVRSWGEKFLNQFKYFDVNPIAAASIGQVHKCQTINGTTLAIKVQYPGVKESIDSDIKNVGFLLSKSGLIPRGIDLTALLELGRLQLHQETNYKYEAGALQKFSKLLKNDDKFEIPKVYNRLTTNDTLAMEFKDGVTIDKAEHFGQGTRNIIVKNLISLLLKELFELKMMQTDPNYANFLFNEHSQKIILLDFGATTKISSHTRDKFLSLLHATKAGDKIKIKKILIKMNFINKNLPEDLHNRLFDIFEKATRPIQTNSFYDFNNLTLIEQMKHFSNDFLKLPDNMTLPNFETLLIQRKIGGFFLLASRLKARIDLNQVLQKYLQ
jgi:predicted unusual protein kinase regulating ubiquinone biosynthesis (AarF/ABC1/UbiB family)